MGVVLAGEMMGGWPPPMESFCSVQDLKAFKVLLEDNNRINTPPWNSCVFSIVFLYLEDCLHKKELIPFLLVSGEV